VDLPHVRLCGVASLILSGDSQEVRTLSHNGQTGFADDHGEDSRFNHPDGEKGFVDGTGVTVRFNRSFTIVVDGEDTVVVVDMNNHRVL